MFFIGGITNSEKKLDYNQSFLCSRCEAFGRMEVYMTYMCFSLFFIPIFKWNKKFFVKTTCCDSIYSLDEQIGYDILKGNPVIIDESNLNPLDNFNKNINRCSNCGYISPYDYEFCPKCGKKL